MALQKNEDFQGINCNYWKILNIRPNYLSDETTAVLGLYKDDATRAASVDNIVNRLNIVASGILETRTEMYPECTASGAYLEGAIDV